MSLEAEIKRGELSRGRFFYFPVVPGRVEFSVALRKLLLERRPKIVAVELPGDPIAGRSLYLKYRDRQSYEFALVSIAAALTVQDGVIADARVALGGVATKPWRARRAEARLVGGPAVPAAFAAAADEELAAAVVREHNAFKVELARRVIIRGLHLAMLESTR